MRRDRNKVRERYPRSNCILRPFELRLRSGLFTVMTRLAAFFIASAMMWRWSRHCCGNAPTWESCHGDGLASLSELALAARRSWIDVAQTTSSLLDATLHRHRISTGSHGLDASR